MQGRESDEKVKVMWNQEGNIPPPLLNSLFTKGKICTRFLFLNISEWYTDPISKQSFLMQFGDARTRKWKWCGIRRETFRPLLASHFLCPNNRSGQLQQFLPAQPENPVFPNKFFTRVFDSRHIYSWYVNVDIFVCCGIAMICYLTPGLIPYFRFDLR